MHQMFCEMKEAYLKMVDEMETLKKDVTEGNSAKIELAKLQKKLVELKMLASKCIENEDGDGDGDGDEENKENKENEAGN